MKKRIHPREIANGRTPRNISINDSGMNIIPEYEMKHKERRMKDFRNSWKNFDSEQNQC